MHGHQGGADDGVANPLPNWIKTIPFQNHGCVVLVNLSSILKPFVITQSVTYKKVMFVLTSRGQSSSNFKPELVAIN